MESCSGPLCARKAWLYGQTLLPETWDSSPHGRWHRQQFSLPAARLKAKWLQSQTSPGVPFLLAISIASGFLRCSYIYAYLLHFGPFQSLRQTKLTFGLKHIIQAIPLPHCHRKMLLSKNRVQITSRKLHFSAYIGASKLGLYVSTKALLK